MTLFLLSFGVASYLLGSIPFSYLAGKLLSGIDLREHGSGNLGATNTYRILGFRVALTVGILDTVKGFLPVLLFPNLSLSLSHTQIPPTLLGTDTLIVIKMFFGFCAIAGHLWTVFLGFRGGKGVTTAFGVFLAIAPLASSTSFATWIAVLWLTETVSVASITTAALFPVYLYLFRGDILGTELLLFIFAIVIAVLVIIRHRSNIARLLKGEEKHIGPKEKQDG